MKLIVLAVALLAVCVVAQDTCAYTDAPSCDAASSCTWCTSGAIKSKCYSIDNSKKLPGGVFVCDKSAPAVHEASPIRAAGPICDICTSVVKSIELPLEQEGCEQFLPKYAEKACSYLGPFSGACVSWLEGECPKIFDLLEKGVASPEAICQDIKACSNPALALVPRPVVKLPVVSPIRASSPFCDICTTVVKKIELPLEHEGCDVFLPKYVEKACSYLGPFSGACISWIEGECPAIFNLLESGVASPQAICQDIHACTNATRVPRQPRAAGAAVKLTATNQGQGACQVCENLVPDFFAAVENVGCGIGAQYGANIVCAKWAPHLPGCAALVVKGCNAIIEAVQHGVSADNICHFLHLC